MAIQSQRYPPDISGLSTVDGGSAAALLQRQQQMLQFQTRISQQKNHQQQRHDSDTAPFDAFGFETGSVCEKQSLEIDQYIRSQSERLRLVLREQRKREVSELIRKIDTRASFLINQKDEEIAREATRTSNLESLLLKLQNEAQTWQQIARQNEFHVASLRNSIQMLQQSYAFHGGVIGGEHGGDMVVDDSESCCDECDDGGAQTVACRMCQIRERSVVLLPCRHLCCCSVCVNMIDLCPVCQTEKKATIEALFL